MNQKDSKESRWNIHLGDPKPEEPRNAVPIMDDAERLREAIDLLDELYLADFMPEEFHVEYERIKVGWTRE